MNDIEKLWQSRLEESKQEARANNFYFWVSIGACLVCSGLAFYFENLLAIWITTVAVIIYIWRAIMFYKKWIHWVNMRKVCEDTINKSTN